MTIRIFSGYSTDYIRPMTASIVKAVLTDQYVDVAAPTGRFFTGFSGSVDNWSYADFLVQLGTTLSANWSGRTAFTFSYDWASNRVTMTALSNSIPVGLNTIWDIGLQRILGFNNQYISQSIIVGDAPPWYVWTATNDHVTDDSEVYEDEPLYKERVADSGRSYSVGRNKTVLYQDWTWGMEPINNVFQNQALITNSFTYDIFIKELRKGPYQFVSFTDEYQTITTMSYAIRNGTYEIREEGFSFKPKAALGDETDFVAYWNIPIKTRILSRPNLNPLNDFANLPVTNSLTPPADGLSLWFKADGLDNTFVSQSIGGACYNQAYDYSTLGNTSYYSLSSSTLFMQTPNFGPCFGNNASPQGDALTNRLTGSSKPFFNTTASGLSFAFPYKFHNTTSNQHNLTFNIACGNATFTPYLSDEYLVDEKTNLYIDISTGSSTFRVSSLASGSSTDANQEHFLIFTYNNTTHTGNIYIDGSCVWNDSGTVRLSASNEVISGVTSSMFVTNPFSYKFFNYLNIGGFTDGFESFVPELLLYNHSVSASEINQINAYFYSRYPVVTYSLQ